TRDSKLTGRCPPIFFEFSLRENFDFSRRTHKKNAFSRLFLDAEAQILKTLQHLRRDSSTPHEGILVAGRYPISSFFAKGLFIGREILLSECSFAFSRFSLFFLQEDFLAGLVNSTYNVLSPTMFNSRELDMPC
ncbi:MAG TPA: hypothetical protein VFQ60_02010, partial [Patescibacteria group bacterium]|nr:hypothetical protein [Patescibacteria group bacterium]